MRTHDDNLMQVSRGLSGMRLRRAVGVDNSGDGTTYSIYLTREYRSMIDKVDID